MKQLIALALAAFLVATSTAHAESILRRGHHDEPESLDPHKTDGTQEIMIEQDLFEGPVRIASSGKLVPGVASSWETSADGLIWIFHLRSNLKWSDGSTLDSGDFVWSLRRALDPATASPYDAILFPIVGAEEFAEGKSKDPASIAVTAPDPDTLVIRLNRPTPYFAGIMATEIAFPVPRKVIEAKGIEWTRPGNLMGNGPFTLESWTPHQDVLLKKNPNYWDVTSVKLDGVRWMTIEEDDTSLRRYRAGEVDIARVPTKDVPMLRREFADQIHTDTILRTDFLILNTKFPPLDDVRIRQALAMALDHNILAGKINPHGQQPAEGLIPPGFPDYLQQWPEWSDWTMEARLAKAQALFQAAGYGPDKPLTLHVMYASGEATRLTLLAIAEMWRPLGLHLVLDNEENGVVNAALRDHQEELSYSDWVADYADPATFLSILDSRNPEENSGQYDNPEYDALIDQSRITLDPVARLQVMEHAERIANRDAAMIPIFYETIPVLVSPKVNGYTPNPLDDVPSRDMGLAE